jgi:hypothetical protein
LQFLQGDRRELGNGIVASNAVRRLRELYQENPDRIEREYRKGASLLLLHPSPMSCSRSVRFKTDLTLGKLDQRLRNIHALFAL